MNSKPDIVCISTQDWGDLWTRKQRFMKRFAEQGFRVLYVETQVHWVTYLLELKSRFRRLVAFLKGPRSVQENLWVITPPLILPFFQMNTLICKINSRLLSWFLRRQLRKLSFNDPVIYSYAPFSGYLMKYLNTTRKLYECVDEFAINKGLVRRKTVERQERDTISQCKAVIVTAPFLFERKRSAGSKTVLIPNAVDADHYRKTNLGRIIPAAVLSKLPKPIVGFVGAVAYWIDLELIGYLSKKLPSYSFVFVGPVSVNVRKLSGFSNIQFLGRKPYDDLPSYLSGIDICMNPYVLDDVASGCSPLKLYEYMAAGKPIVSVRMPEAEKFADLIEIADSYEEFACKIELLASKNNSWKRNFASKAWRVSQNHTWDRRFKQTLDVLTECFDENRN